MELMMGGVAYFVYFAIYHIWSYFVQQCGPHAAAIQYYHLNSGEVHYCP